MGKDLNGLRSNLWGRTGHLDESAFHIISLFNDCIKAKDGRYFSVTSVVT